jgi:hypothetical protein
MPEVKLRPAEHTISAWLLAKEWQLATQRLSGGESEFDFSEAANFEAGENPESFKQKLGAGLNINR